MNRSLTHEDTASTEARCFWIASQHFEPAYLALHRRGELCPRDGGVDRLADETGVCKTGRYARVSSYFPHFGEEDCLRGWQGSGRSFSRGATCAVSFARTTRLARRVRVLRLRRRAWPP